MNAVVSRKAIGLRRAKVAGFNSLEQEEDTAALEESPCVARYHD